jgi:hypothetical protein
VVRLRRPQIPNSNFWGILKFYWHVFEKISSIFYLDKLIVFPSFFFFCFFFFCFFVLLFVGFWSSTGFRSIQAAKVLIVNKILINVCR